MKNLFVFIIIWLVTCGFQFEDIVAMPNQNTSTETSTVIVEYKNTSAMNFDRIKFKRFRTNIVSSDSKIMEINFNTINNAKQQLKLILQNQNVSKAELKYIYLDAVFIEPNDPNFKDQYFIKLMRFPEAWDLVKGNSNFIVSAPDNGLDVLQTFTDLPNLKLPGYNAIDGSNNYTYDRRDYTTHGITTSGLIAAETNNNFGVSSGIWQAKLLPMRIGYPSDQIKSRYLSTASLALKAIEYGAANGVKVISLSYIFGPQIWLADAARKYNIPVIIGGGNDNENLKYGPTHKYLIIVGATAQPPGVNSRASFSNYGIGIDVFCPGQNLLTLDFNNKTKNFSGTSASAPLAASLVALMKVAKPTITIPEIKRILKTTSVDIGAPGWDQFTGWGRLDAYDAIRATLGLIPLVDTKPPIVGIMEFDVKYWLGYGSYPGFASEIFPVWVNADDNFEVAKVEFFIDNQKIYEHTNYDGYSQFRYMLETRKYSNGIHTLKAIATDVTGLSSQTTYNINIKNITDDINPPIITINSPANKSILVGNFNVNLTVIDASPISKVEFYIDNILVDVFTSSPYVKTYNTSNFTIGNKILKFIAYDSANNKQEITTEVKFADSLDTTPPVVFITSPKSLAIINAQQSISFNSLIKDDGGIVRVRLYRDNVFVKDSITPPYIITENGAGLVTGRDYTYVMEAIDTSGNIGRSLPVLIRRR